MCVGRTARASVVTASWADDEAEENKSNNEGVGGARMAGEVVSRLGRTTASVEEGSRR